MYEIFLWVVIALFIGHWWGWVSAHYMVASECEKNGGFFVGKKIFKCTAVKVYSREDQYPGL